MSPIAKLVIVAASLALAGAPSLTLAVGVAEPRSAAAVLAADDAWMAAEIRGDGAFLSELLLPRYRSVGAKGQVTDKATIVKHATARGNDPTFAAKVVAWKSDHPTRAEVLVEGDTAIVAWVVATPGLGEPVSSFDMFVYRSGRWRALYSQHTAASE